MNNEAKIDVIVIGVNAEPTLEACLKSIFRSSFAEIRAFYVDGGSSDKSLEIARRFPRLELISLYIDCPTPGLQRNKGWKRGKAPLVQFLDSDTILHTSWLKKAAAAMRDGVGAVRGNRTEMRPEDSVFNWIGNLEWNAKPGECDAFGGDVLLRRCALESTGGYDEAMVGGEDPELAQRVKQNSWQIIQLDEPMTRHDLAMTKAGQYLRRAYRTGYGYASVHDKHGKKTRDFWFLEVRRIVVRAGGFLFFAGLGLTGAFWRNEALLFLCPAFFLLLFPRIFRLEYFSESKKLSRKEAKTYAWHCSLVVLPEFFGILRFVFGKFFNRPLKNRRKKLKTGGWN